MLLSFDYRNDPKLVNLNNVPAGAQVICVDSCPNCASLDGLQKSEKQIKQLTIVNSPKIVDFAPIYFLVSAKQLKISNQVLVQPDLSLL